MDILELLEIYTVDDSTVVADVAVNKGEKGKPKKDGSGKGIRANKGRGGCSPEEQKKKEEEEEEDDE